MAATTSNVPSGPPPAAAAAAAAPPRKKKSRFAPSTNLATTSAPTTSSDKLALLALIQQRTKSLEADLPALMNKAGSGLAAAPALVLDKHGKDVATTSMEAAKRLREHASLKINRDVAKKKAVNPYLAHRSSSSSSSSSLFSSSSSSASSLLVIDHRVKADRVTRNASRDFKFVKVGALVARAERLQKKSEKAIQGGTVGKTHFIRDMDVVNDSSILTGTMKAVATAKQTMRVPPVPTSMVEDAKRSETVGCEWWDLSYLEPTKSAAAKDLLRRRASSSSSSSSAAASSTSTSSTLSSKDTMFPCAVDDFNIENSKTWKLVQKPQMLAPIGEALDPGPQPVRLTKKERKKIRRRNRAEKQMEEQDKIRLGIIPAPAPKIKMSNLMKVLGNEAVMDPSKMEKDIREGKQQRQLDHEMRNLAAKKTPAEARAKITKKLKGDREKAEKEGINVAVFKITGELLDATKRFKIDMNARQLYLSGVCLIVHDDEDITSTVVPANMIVVEGGAKGIKTYKKLLLRRIKWAQDHPAYQLDEQRRQQEEMNNDESDVKTKDDDDEEEEDGDEDEKKPIRHSKFPMECKLMWEGVVSESKFPQFRLEECKSVRSARGFAKNNKCEHYWNMVE